MKKLGVFISHPIHYQTPLYQLLVRQVEIKPRVYFYSRYGAEKYFDPQFQKEIVLDTGLLDGYPYEFLANVSWEKGFRFFSFINWGIPRLIKTGKFDAVLINSWSYFSDWLVIFSTFLFKTPILMRTENPYNQEIIKPQWKRAIKRILFGGLVFPRIKAFLYIGDENKKFYQYYGVPDHKLFFAPYCVDNEKFIRAHATYAPAKASLKKELGINLRKVVILCGSSKLIPKKRPLDMLAAYNHLKNENAALVFLGEGELRGAVEQYIRDHNLRNVHLVGFQKQKDIPRFYALADIFVLPSGSGETWGLMVNEAMCNKLPVIVSDMVGCGSDLVRDGENGFIFKLGDTDGLAQCLTQLVSDEAMRNRFGEKSYEIIQAYSYAAVVRGIQEALQ